LLPVLFRLAAYQAPPTMTTHPFEQAIQSLPAAERGYYVFPVHMVKRILEDDGLSDANMVRAADTRVLAGLFDADAVLYVTIEQWNAKYLVLNTTVTVEFDYMLKDGKTGEEIWHNREIRQFSSDNGGGGGLAGLVAAAITAGITKAAPNYVPMSKQAHSQAITEANSGVPAGPYHPQYKKDMAYFPEIPIYEPVPKVEPSSESSADDSEDSSSDAI
jgi:hypothetical protein